MKQKKSLGQNFFVNKNLAKQIVSYVISNKFDTLVEIGPGTGYFTEIIRDENKNNKKYNNILIEKDNYLAKELAYTYFNYKVINTDFLDWDFKELDSNKKICFFGSLPYNVSKKIIKKIIESKYFNTNCYFIIQKEVADKYVAKQPNNNLLSTVSDIYANKRKIMDIKPQSFNPPPKVTSSFIEFSPKEINQTLINKEKDFIKFLEICYKQPRKTIKNNISKAYPNINPNMKILEKRPQHISFDEYTKLFSNI